MEHGTITTVNYEQGAVTCDVRAVRSNTQYQNVPVMKPHATFIALPTQGERVAMEQLSDGTRFISNVIDRDPEAPDDMSEGELAIQIDGGTRVQFKEKQNGNYDLHLDASGDVYINGTKQ